MKFIDNMSINNKELQLDDSSVLITSRFAQDFWLHCIDEDHSISDVRYSFTFRHIAPHFANSTIIIGDSNTKNLKFVSGAGKFGKWMPGKVMSAIHIEDIPNPEEIGPFRNIVIHTGINNIKLRNRRSSQTLVNELEAKCTDILDLYPNTKLYISQLLPTKIHSLNYVVREFNNLVLDMACNHQRLRVIEQSTFSSHDGCLNDEFGRFSDRRPNPTDVLHLGRNGIRKFSQKIKSSIMRTKFAMGQSRGHHDGYQPPR